MKKINNGKRLAFDLLLMAFLLMTIVPVFAAETNNIPSATQQKTSSHRYRHRQQRRSDTRCKCNGKRDYQRSYNGR